MTFFQVHNLLLRASDHFWIFFCCFRQARCHLPSLNILPSATHSNHSSDSNRSVCGYKYYGILVAIMVTPSDSRKPQHFTTSECRPFPHFLISELRLCSVWVLTTASGCHCNKQRHFRHSQCRSSCCSMLFVAVLHSVQKTACASGIIHQNVNTLNLAYFLHCSCC
jgi:hypothetical protein